MATYISRYIHWLQWHIRITRTFKKQLEFQLYTMNKKILTALLSITPLAASQTTKASVTQLLSDTSFLSLFKDCSDISRITLRAAFHDVCSLSLSEDWKGGLDGSILYEYKRPENRGYVVLYFSKDCNIIVFPLLSKPLSNTSHLR